VIAGIGQSAKNGILEKLFLADALPLILAAKGREIYLPGEIFGADIRNCKLRYRPAMLDSPASLFPNRARAATVPPSASIIWKMPELFQ